MLRGPECVSECGPFTKDFVLRNKDMGMEAGCLQNSKKKKKNMLMMSEVKKKDSSAPEIFPLTHEQF